MIFRRFPDAVVVFDPVNGRTFQLTRDEFDVLQAICEFVDGTRTSIDEAVEHVVAELGAREPLSDSVLAGDRVENVRRWVEMAIRLTR